MGERKLTKRSFFKSLGALAVLGMLFPWLKKSDNASFSRDYPLAAQKDPNAIPRPSDLA